MAWCGTFSTTKDGLPFIGNCPDKDRMFFDLGYGGNGIPFSMSGAQIICKKLQGIDDERGRIFGYPRTRIVAPAPGAPPSVIINRKL